MYAYPDTTLVAEASAEPWHTVGENVILSATVTADSVPVAGATVAADVRVPNATRTTVTLHDDGILPDAAIIDGIYTGSFAATQTGVHIVDITATGTHGVNEYLRMTKTTFAVAPATHTLSGTYSEQAVDVGSDGVFDYLDVTVDIEASAAANIVLSAQLEGPAGDIIDRAATEVIEADIGSYALVFRFSGAEIFDSGIDGPYTITDVKIFDDDEFLVLDTINDEIWWTVPYAYTDFGVEANANTVYLPTVVTSYGALRAIAPTQVDGTYTTVTDADGNYVLDDLPAGTYVVTAIKSGASFTPQSRTVIIPPDATGQDFVLQSGGGTPGERVLIPAGEFQMGCHPDHNGG